MSTDLLSHPDIYCVTLPDGSCASEDPRCMHQPLTFGGWDVATLWEYLWRNFPSVADAATQAPAIEKRVRAIGWMYAPDEVARRYDSSRNPIFEKNGRSYFWDEARTQYLGPFPDRAHAERGIESLDLYVSTGEVDGFLVGTSWTKGGED